MTTRDVIDIGLCLECRFALLSVIRLRDGSYAGRMYCRRELCDNHESGGERSAPPGKAVQAPPPGV